eukprot:489727_1
MNPSNASINPTINPSIIPTDIPTYLPTNNPTYIPTSTPTISPTYKPSVTPTGNVWFITTFEVTYLKGKLQSENDSLMKFIWLAFLVIICIFVVIICILLIVFYKIKKQKEIKHKKDVINTIEIMNDEMNVANNKNTLKYWLNDMRMGEYFNIFVKEGFGDDI